MTSTIATSYLVLLLAIVGTVHGDLVHLKGAVASDVSELFESELGVYTQEHPSFSVSFKDMVSEPALALLSASSVTSSSSINFAITQNTAPSGNVCKTNGLLPVPVVAGVGGIFYNVPGLVDPKLSACALAHIFAGSITKWSDPAIQTLNPDAKLPNTPIRVVVRDDPLTPQLLTYLREQCPSATDRLGASGPFAYPATFTRVVKISDMVALINSTLYTVGFGQASSFRGGPEVAIQNRAGQFVTSATADRTSFADVLTLPQDPRCWGEVETTNLPGTHTHPLMYLVYYVAPAPTSSPRPTQNAVASLAGHLLSSSAQQRAAGLGYQPLASALLQAAVANQRGLQPTISGSDQLLPSGAIASIVAACVIGAVLLAAGGQVLYRRSLKAGWLCTWPDYTDCDDPEAATAPVLPRDASLSANRARSSA